MIRDQRKKKKLKAFCLLLALAVVCTVGLLPEVNASAAETPTSLGLAAHGIKAHRDGWLYVYGGKGQTVGGTRGSDCAGLLYAYFSDVGAIGNCRGGATTQVEDNCVFSNDVSEGIPNIHGLALTMPDYYDPGTGIYGHIGIYIGNNEATDNSDATYNMRREPVIGSGRNWTAWHVFDNGMKYPVDGWYQIDGKMVHYTHYEYDTDTTIDGYRLGSDGYACDEAGKPVPVNAAILSTQYATASQVASYLRTKYSGKDSTYELIYGGNRPDPAPDYNGRVTGSEVRLRQAANTSSGIVTVLSKGTSVNILEEVTGETISGNGTSSNKWYSVVTANGHSGYICALYVERVSTVSPTSAPVIEAADGYVTITAAPGMDIYYTTDCSTPTELSTPYTAPVYLTGYTFKAIAIGNGTKTPVATASVLSDGSVFTDFTSKDWFFPVVDLAVSDHIFRGAGNGTFNPTGKITRAQFVMALANLDRVDLSLYEGGTSFSDLNGLDSRTKLAIIWASEEGYVTGAGNGTFRPWDPISREQMCTILARYAGLERNHSSSPFADDFQISSWAKDAVYACRDKGLINGVGGNRFNPKGTASRAEACVVTTKYYHAQDGIVHS